MPLTYEEIIKSFDTPSQVRHDALARQNKIMEDSVAINRKVMHKLAESISKEHNIIADNLDKKDANWRVTLVAGIKKLR